MLNPRPAIRSDLRYVAARMRMDDIQELKSGGYIPTDIVQTLSVCVKVRAIGPYGAPYAVFGVHEEGIAGRIWAFVTDEGLKHWREIHRATPALLDELGEDFAVLFNVKLSTHTKTIRWLKSLGFVFFSTIDINGVQFHEFARIQP